MNLRALGKILFLSIALSHVAHAYEADDYVEPFEADEHYDEVPPAATTFPAQKPYRKKDYNVEGDEPASSYGYDEFAPVDDYQDYGFDSGGFDGATEYDSYDSYDSYDY